MHREDFCKDCWRSELNKETYSTWNVVYHDPRVESEEPPEVFSPLRQLFYEAAEEESRIEMAKAFLAAGLLRRQKVFRLIKESDEAEGNVRITLYTDRLGNRLIEVPDPQFSYAELESARIKLMERLQELETAAAAPAEPESNGAPEAVEAESAEAAPEEQAAPEDAETVGSEGATAEESLEDDDAEASAAAEDTVPEEVESENPEASAAEEEPITEVASEDEEAAVGIGASDEAEEEQSSAVSDEESMELVEEIDVVEEEVLHAEA